MLDGLTALVVLVLQILIDALVSRVLCRAWSLFSTGSSEPGTPARDSAKEQSNWLPSPAAPVVDGGRFLHEFARLRPVAAAFWRWEGSVAEWCLYVVTPDNFDPLADRDVGRAAAASAVSLLDFQVKLIG